MSTNYTNVDWAPIQGIDSQDNELLIGPSKAAVGTTNFLFEAGQAYVRPGALAVTLTGFSAGDLSGGIQYAQSVIVGSVGYTIYITGEDKIYYTTAGSAIVTQITGSALSFGNPWEFSMAVVNGAVIIGNNTGGLVHWVAAAGTYTIIAAAPYKFVTSHLNRAVAANCMNASAGPAPSLPQGLIVAWSAPGSETTWTNGTGNDGSGYAVLSDCQDDITAIGTQGISIYTSSVLVILRRRGISLGFVTGQAFPAYNFFTFILLGVGCFFSPSAVFDTNSCYFMSEDGPYSFSGGNMPQPIGGPVSNQLVNAHYGGEEHFFKGLLVRVHYPAGIGTNVLTGQQVVRQRYVLAPCGTDNSNTALFVYDTLQQSWSICSIAVQNTIPSPFIALGSGSSSPYLEQGLAYFGTASPGSTSQAYSLWDLSLACESTATLFTSTMQIGQDPFLDWHVMRLLLRYRDFNAPLNSISFTIKLGRGATAIAAGTMAVNLPTPNNDGRWIQGYVDLYGLQLVGQFVNVEVNVPVLAAPTFVTDFIRLQCVQSGEFRGS